MQQRRASKRFDRSTPEGVTSPNIRLTEDDIQVLWHVYRHRLIDSKCLYRLFPGRSKQQLSRRLNLLFRNHYLGRPERQVELFPPGEGSNHLIYGLDREAAKLLKEAFGARVGPYHWLQKNREITRTNIAHTVSTSNFMAQLEQSVRASGRARIVHFDELLNTFAPGGTKKRPIPEQWQVDVSWRGHRGREGTRPDRIFALEYFNLPKGKNLSFFYFENDEGTETIEPTVDQRQLTAFFRKSSILRKFVIYSYSHLSRAHEDHFGFPVAPRILTLTTSPARVVAMQDAFARHFREQPLNVQPGLFLFLDRSTLEKSEQGVFSATWLDGVKRPMQIDDR